MHHKHNKRWGRGKCLWEDWLIYEGYWEDGFAAGKGRLLAVRNDRKLIFKGRWHKHKSG
jgi:hypothetical protein